MQMNTKRRSRAPAQATECEEIQQPSIITPLHVQDRETSTVAGAPRAWRKQSQLEAAYMQERLGARDCKDARDRYDAGRLYTMLWDCSQKAGRDSTAGFDVVRCMGSGLPLTEHQASAIRRVVAIDMHLSLRDRTIIRAVLAYGYTPAEAMGRAKLGKDTRVSARFCEALDSLVDAVERTAPSKRR
jgi:hypothetical protein